MSREASREHAQLPFVSYLSPFTSSLKWSLCPLKNLNIILCEVAPPGCTINYFIETRGRCPNPFYSVSKRRSIRGNFVCFCVSNMEIGLQLNPLIVRPASVHALHALINTNPCRFHGWTVVSIKRLVLCCLLKIFTFYKLL